MKFILFILVLIVAGCATVDYPSGGEKDEVAPKVEVMIPPNESVNFNSAQIMIEFDEFFNLRNPRSQVIISPTLPKPPKFEVKGKRLYITFQSELQENTTYNIYFAGAIKDLNEGNDTSFSYVFSTGQYLDSLRMSARVVDAFSGKPVENVWVTAYQNDDSLVDQKMPDYIAQTGKDGIARFSYLPDKSFNVFALDDKSSDLYFNSFEEKLGFHENKVSSSDSLVPEIRLFLPQDTALYNSGFKYSKGKLDLIFNKEVDISRLNLLPENLSFPNELNDTVHILLPSEMIKKGNSQISFKLNGKRDTVRFYIPKDLDTTTISPRFLNKKAQAADRPVVLKHATPVRSIDTSGVYLFKDSVAIVIDNIRWSNDSIIIDAPLKSGKQYRLVIDKRAISGTNLVYSDSSSYAFSVVGSDYFGSIELEFKGMNGLVELVRNNKVIRRKHSNERLRFERLTPGKYTVRLIEDEDESGDWTTGSWIERKQPEIVHHYPQELDVRSGWSIEEVWFIDQE